MAGESQDSPTSGVPDPSVLTTESLALAISNLKEILLGRIDVLRERLDGMDKAAVILSETVNRVPTDVQQKVQHLRELTDVKFDSISTQFEERDTRQERESRDNKVALDAALAAQKDAASAQNDSNTLGINKSEQATTETINKMGDLNKSNSDALADKILDLGRRMDRFESARQGAAEQSTGARLTLGTVIGVVGTFVAVISVVVAVVVAMSR